MLTDPLPARLARQEHVYLIETGKSALVAGERHLRILPADRHAFVFAVPAARKPVPYRIRNT